MPPTLIAHDPLGVSAGRRVTDCAAAPDPLVALAQRAADYVPGDTDLSWARTTLWRGLLASAFDSVQGAPTSAVVCAEPGSPSAALLAGWLQTRLEVPVERRDHAGEGVQEVTIDVQGTRLVVTRADGQSATLRRTDQPDRVMPLPRREIGDLLAEELRRLDADEPYAEALAAATGDRSPLSPPQDRTHIWSDPAAGA